MRLLSSLSFRYSFSPLMLCFCDPWIALKNLCILVIYDHQRFMMEKFMKRLPKKITINEIRWEKYLAWFLQTFFVKFQSYIDEFCAFAGIPGFPGISRDWKFDPEMEALMWTKIRQILSMQINKRSQTTLTIILEGQIVREHQSSVKSLRQSFTTSGLHLPMNKHCKHWAAVVLNNQIVSTMLL